MTNESLEKIKRYYRKRESRLGYRYMLGGTRHYGYWNPPSQKIDMKRAQVQMEDKLAESLGLAPGARVLDAGCGEGRVARRLASKHGLEIVGIDLLDESIELARSETTTDLASRVTFEVGNYSETRFADQSFDGIYTMETLVHSPDLDGTLREFRRLLKPGGKIVHFEYAVPPRDEMSDSCSKTFAEVSEDSGMYAYPLLVNDALSNYLESLDFSNLQVEDITPNILPMLKRFYRYAFVPYYVFGLLGRRRREVNVRAAVEGWRCRNSFKYLITSGSKSTEI